LFAAIFSEKAMTAFLPSQFAQSLEEAEGKSRLFVHGLGRHTSNQRHVLGDWIHVGWSGGVGFTSSGVDTNPALKVLNPAMLVRASLRMFCVFWDLVV
jgi:hypothetical protein